MRVVNAPPRIMEGATADEAGVAGYVPTPPAGPVHDALRRDGTYGPANGTGGGGGGSGGIPDDGSVTNAKVAADAAIALSKLAVNPLARANHTGTQSADTLTDGATNKAFLATERTKLAGVATGATANDTDANLKARANHTGTQPQSSVTNLELDLAAKVPTSYLDPDTTLAANSDTKVPTQKAVKAYVDAHGGGGGGGAVDSVNGQTGIVVLDASHVDPATDRNYVTDEKAALLADTTEAFTTAKGAKLAGIAPGATANDSDANLKARANHTGTQDADTIVDGTTNKVFTATEKTKLAGVATGATANDTDANLKARANHTGTQAIGTVTGLQAELDSKAADADLAAHTADTANPHGVTNTQVGLGNVTNDAQLKASDLDTDPALAADSDTKVPSQKAVKAYVDAHSGGGGGAVDSVNGQTGAVVLDTSNIEPSTNRNYVTDGKAAIIASMTAPFTSMQAGKLAGIAPAATANDTDANLKDRANHTGTQAISTVTDLQTTLDAKATAANLTAHTGNTGNPHSVTKAQVGLANVTNDEQTKATVVPNTAPEAGQILVGNIGGTAYAPKSLTGEVEITSEGLATIANNAINNDKVAANAAISLEKLATNPLARANHTGTQDISTVAGLQTALDQKASQEGVGSLADAFFEHQENVNNPHGVTKAQVGLGSTADGATVNSPDATLLARANHTGTQDADTIVDGATNKVFTATEKTKLAGISPEVAAITSGSINGATVGATTPGTGAFTALSSAQSSPYGAFGTGAAISIRNTDASVYNASEFRALDSGGNVAGGLSVIHDSHGASGSSALQLVARNAGALSVPVSITSTGNVGIGTTTPSRRLTAAIASGVTDPASDGGSQVLSLENTDLTDQNTLGTVFAGYDSGSVRRTAAGIFAHFSDRAVGAISGALSFWTKIGAGAPTERVRITPDGNLTVTGAIKPSAAGVQALAGVPWAESAFNNGRGSYLAQSSSVNPGIHVVTTSGLPSQAIVSGSAARGSLTALAPTETSDGLLLLFRSFGGSTWANAARVNLYASGTHTETSRPTYVSIETAAAGSTTVTERARFDADGLAVTGDLRVSGTTIIGENAPLSLPATLTGDGKYAGITEPGVAAAALTFGQLVYFVAATSRWDLTDADASATAGPVRLGICVVAAAGAGSATRILTYGKVRADAAFPALTIGAPVYVSTNPGAVQTAYPNGTDDVIRAIGHGVTADELFFAPSNDYMTHV